ncbi:MAG: hypothetical protein GXP55_19460, partial [Deltaproteobacteria bacterium]|nr:hypothetical protein [Deltaproteobacteria bacterium]
MDEEDWEPMPSVVGIPLPDEDVVDSDGAPERVSEEPEALSGEDLMEAELDEAELEVDDLQWVSGVPLPEPPPPLPATARAFAPPPPVPFTPATRAAPSSAGRSSFVDLDELLEEVIRDDSTRPVPFVPRPDLSTAETPHARRWPYALAALAAGAVV